MERYVSIIGDLYAGALDDAAGMRGLLGIADMVRASAVLLLAFNPSSGAILRDENHRLDPRSSRAIGITGPMKIPGCRPLEFLWARP
jgi:hypothetical protein